MKQKDFLLVSMVVLLSGIISFFASQFLFSPSSTSKTEVEVVEPISAEFITPDKRYFNAKSINPTQLIRIGDDQNQQPFQQKQS